MNEYETYDTREPSSPDIYNRARLFRQLRDALAELEAAVDNRDQRFDVYSEELAAICRVRRARSEARQALFAAHLIDPDPRKQTPKP
jgi:hypothetical protein